MSTHPDAARADGGARLDDMAGLEEETATSLARTPAGDPPLLFPPYRSTRPRSPRRALVPVPEELMPLDGPAFGHLDVTETDADLTRQHDGEPIGERMTVTGRVLDSDGRPVRHQLVEVWQANAAGRYPHPDDQHPAPLDPNFSGGGRCVTDDDGRYRFTTIKPGPYPWKNHYNAWRPAHIHFSLFGTGFTQRLITQMYFPNDPLFAFDPIVHAVPDPAARQRLVARFDMATTVPEQSLGYVFDVVLRGRGSTPLEGS